MDQPFRLRIATWGKTMIPCDDSAINMRSLSCLTRWCATIGSASCPTQNARRDEHLIILSRVSDFLMELEAPVSPACCVIPGI